MAIVGGTALGQTDLSAPALDESLTRAEKLLEATENGLRIVETEYVEKAAPTPTQLQNRRFSDGEIQFLLSDYAHASVLFYDLVSDATFREQHPRYADALHYLAESLHHQGNHLGARVYLRQLLGLNSAHNTSALMRLLEIAARFGEFSGLDALVEQAKAQAGGKLSSDLRYVLGKWQLERADLPRDQRLTLAEQTFTELAQESGRFALPASYFLGVVAVKRGDLKAALERFASVSKPADPKKAQAMDNGRALTESRIRELAVLSAGRVLFELERFDEAADRYQDIDRNSEWFADALYETAWCRVRTGKWEQAKNATDLVMLVAPDSTLAPEALILQGHLLLKLKRYPEADKTYNDVINAFAPVRDEIDALLTVNRDPVAYFDQLLAKQDGALDVRQLLPEVALKWATTQADVANAVRLMTDLGEGRDGVAAANNIAERIVKALETRPLEVFPALQEGHARADAIASAITRVFEQVTFVDVATTAPVLPAYQRGQLEILRAAQAGHAMRFSRLPTTPVEVAARRARLQEQVDALDKKVFQLSTELQNLNAIATAIVKWVDDTRAVRSSDPEDEKAFVARVKNETAELAWLTGATSKLRDQLAEERERASASILGEDKIRSDYRRLLDEQSELVRPFAGQVSPPFAAVSARATRLRASATAIWQRTETARAALAQQLIRRGAEIRAKVAREQELLTTFTKESSTLSTDARQTVGKVAFDSFRRVRRQFYELVLKADVGLVDVAFTRKQDKTSEIQRISAQKDEQLRALDTEFRDVLEDDI
ncbi:MAG: tetratricopeptide repeat protein [Myxococcaceae bacterium]